MPTYDGVGDGRHTLTIEAVDRAGNVAQASRTVLIDNTPPAAPQQLAVDGGDGWRTSPKFTLRWTEPGQQAGSGGAARAVSPASDTSAPIAGVEWKMCPAGKSTGCISGSKTQANITSLDLEVPKPGDWNTSVWLRDSAGNAQPATAANVRLRYDNDSPDVVFAAVNADDPARIHVSASDPSSAIAGGELSLRQVESQRQLGALAQLPRRPGARRVQRHARRRAPVETATTNSPHAPSTTRATNAPPTAPPTGRRPASPCPCD